MSNFDKDCAGICGDKNQQHRVYRTVLFNELIWPSFSCHTDGLTFNSLLYEENIQFSV